MIASIFKTTAMIITAAFVALLGMFLTVTVFDLIRFIMS